MTPYLNLIKKFNEIIESRVPHLRLFYPRWVACILHHENLMVGKLFEMHGTLYAKTPVFTSIYDEHWDLKVKFSDNSQM